MKPEDTDAVLRWFGRFKEAGVLVYEMIGLE
jgi:[phosphatase 2A protein]-leucine-carboxy methyltransferase